ncbi:MAG: hypothetical protein V4599_08260 [Verrucomicrobiota bacterium]
MKTPKPLVWLLFVLFLILMGWFYRGAKAWNDETDAIKTNHSKARLAVLEVVRAVMVSANKTKKLPENVNQLQLPSHCKGTMYFVSDVPGGQKVIVAYLSDGNAQNHRGTHVEYVEMNFTQERHFLPKDMDTDATFWEGLSNMLSGGKWTVEVVHG